MSKHTPGPWIVNETTDGSEIHGQSDEGPVVAWCNPYRPEPDAIGCGGDPVANARLMAAAPDMLAALEEMLPYAETAISNLLAQMGGSLYPAVVQSQLDRAVAAIAKAKGGDA